VPVVGFILFFAAGFVFGYAAPGGWAFLPVVIPIVVGLYTMLTEGLDATVVLLTVLGVIVAVLGAIAGKALLYRLEGPEAPGSAP
jgi:hypothetical protein